ncbi:MAG: DNA repair protein RadC [Methylococcales bacterium]|jgi:DNA repair protein RadC|nr:DNA repair protein RadC [Methylococcales bacterium]
MAISTWPEQAQPREKLITRGSESLTDAELLAIFLRTGTRDRNAVELASDLLQKFGGLHKLLTADFPTLTGVKGLGSAKFAQLQAGLEIGRRFLEAQLEHTNVLNNPDDTKKYLQAHLKHHQHEVFACLFLDSQNQIIQLEKLFTGTLSRASVHPREVVKRCLFHNAANIILAHNHPSGNSQPSAADKKITQSLQQALALIEIQVLDHIVIGDNSAVSLAELGWI